MKTTVYLCTRILSLLLLVSIAISCANEKIESPEDITVTIAFVDKGLVLNGNENNVFDKSAPEESIVYVAPNANITWELGEGLSSIAIRIDSGEAIFDITPKADGNGNYTGKISGLESGEAKYSVIYTVIGDDTVFVLDPVVRINSEA